MVLLRGCRTGKAHLARQIATVLLLCVSSGWLVHSIEHRVHLSADFDLQLIPYICLAATPVIILRYRLQAIGETGPSPAFAAPPIPEAVQKPEAVPALEAAPAIEDTPAPEPAPNPDRRYEKSGLDASRMDAYEVALATYMRKSKIYLDPDLSLDGLASKMKMSKHHLTQLLNERIMKNFYNFINEYRIGEAIDRLNNPALQVNILSLAFDCGFNSRSSFNSYFKKITGHTPSAYRKIRLIRDTSPSA
jgi:AraC-like DNA-binding protein